MQIDSNLALFHLCFLLLDLHFTKLRESFLDFFPVPRQKWKWILVTKVKDLSIQQKSPFCSLIWKINKTWASSFLKKSRKIKFEICNLVCKLYLVLFKIIKQKQYRIYQKKKKKLLPALQSIIINNLSFKDSKPASFPQGFCKPRQFTMRSHPLTVNHIKVPPPPANWVWALLWPGAEPVALTSAGDRGHIPKQFRQTQWWEASKALSCSEGSKGLAGSQTPELSIL